MHDALAWVTQTEQCYAAFTCIGLKIAYHRRDLGIGDGLIAAVGRHIMVGNSECQPRFGNPATALLHLAESVERPFVHIVPVDPKQGGSVVATHNLMRRPQLVYEGQGLTHTGSSLMVAALLRVRNIVDRSSRTLNNRGASPHNREPKGESSCRTKGNLAAVSSLPRRRLGPRLRPPAASRCHPFCVPRAHRSSSACCTQSPVHSLIQVSKVASAPRWPLRRSTQSAA